MLNHNAVILGADQRLEDAAAKLPQGRERAGFIRAQEARITGHFGGEETTKLLNVLIDGVKVDCYTRSFDDFEIHMLALAGTRTPFLITLKYPDREFAVRYLKYETGGEVDYSLFEVPESVNLRSVQ